MRSKIAALAAALALWSVMASGALADDAAAKTAWNFTFTAIEGGPMPFANFRGKVLLVVNTASFCGYTKQYKALQALHEKYEGQGFAVIGVPSNDFGGQEPNAPGEIKSFCQGIYGVTFPLTDKNVVSGESAHPFYKWARDELGWLNAPKWNFHKYLVGRDGRLVTSFFSMTEPDSERVTAAVEAELAKPPAANVN